MKISFHDWSDDPGKHQFTTRDTVSCKVTFEATEADEWHSLGVDTAFSVSGSMRSQTHTVKTHVFESNVTMAAGEKRTYDFTTTLIDSVAYRGKNGSAGSRLVGFARPPDNKVGFFKRLTGQTGWVRLFVDITVREGHALRVEQAPVKMNAQRDNRYMVVFAIAAVVISVLFFIGLFPFQVAAITWFIYVVVFSCRSYVIRKVGEITLVPTASGGPNWLAKITVSEFGGGVKSMEAYYEVKEKVLDDRGTSSSTSYHTLHKSPTDQRNGNGTVYRFEHRFPDDCPPSRNYGDLDIIWAYHVKVEAQFGLNFRYEGKLKVKRG